MERGWLSLPIIATVSRLLCRELTLQVEYLQAENRILRSKVKNRVVYTEVERRTLVDAALAMGMDLMRKVVKTNATACQIRYSLTALTNSALYTDTSMSLDFGSIMD
jgi:hypothetical protein